MSDTQRHAAAGGSKPLRIAILNCPGSERYDECFKTWLSPEATGQPVEWEVFEAAEGQLPPPGGDAFDGYIITGSRHGVYEEVPWIQQLCGWVAEAHAEKSKILGVCFGHQAVAKALGGTVTINPAGFEIGRYTSALTDDAAAYFQRLEVEAAAAGASERAGEGGDASSSAGATRLSALRMNFVHGDYVPLDGIPPGLYSMGGTALSPHNGLFNGSNLLTFQGHPEFTAANVKVCMEKLTERQVLPQRLPPGVDARGVERTLPGPVDAPFLALTAMRFFRDGR